MSVTSTPSSPSLSTTSGTSYISFCYTWTTRIKTRITADGDSTILSISPKFATVHQLISFQWNIRIHSTKEMSEDEEDDEEKDDYVAVDLYFVDGPVNEVTIMADVGTFENSSTQNPNPNPAILTMKESKSLKMQKGVECEITEDSSKISKYLKENVDKIVRISVVLHMESRLFEPFTYLDSISPTPRASFLTANYNARVNSKVWRRRSKKRTCRSLKHCISDKEKINYEKKVQEILDDERERIFEKDQKQRIGFGLTASQFDFTISRKFARIRAG
ncbi:unnamed protein product [Caenorhabditis angaria]|uniref:Uncharacterized protein n=1 Tax=Caenorhabditis angaria TaxID=860376 RepID=A0A9P1I525_9PELO|nr:unnamed protein product [Caenorhabditis angaria]